MRFIVGSKSEKVAGKFGREHALIRCLGQIRDLERDRFWRDGISRHLWSVLVLHEQEALECSLQRYIADLIGRQPANRKKKSRHGQNLISNLAKLVFVKHDYRA